MKVRWIRLLRWWPFLLLLPLAGLWLLPLSGKVMVTGSEPEAEHFPAIHLDPARPAPGQPVMIRVRDGVPWTHVRLTVNGKRAEWVAGKQLSDGTAHWEWHATFPEAPAADILFYRDCHTGCIEQARRTVEIEAGHRPEPSRRPTKLGVVFPDPTRDWHGRSGWAVELTYARLADGDHWGIDALAERVQQAERQGLRVLVRVDYDYGQSVPPEEDGAALERYLQHLEQLARDDRLQGIYGYIIGSGYNAGSANRLAAGQPTSPAWYARLFNGYGEAAARTDNVVQVLRGTNPQIRALVGPIRPWISDRGGKERYRIDVPWLNYMNTLVAALDAGAMAKTGAGIALAAPDGFALQVPGRPDAPELDGREPAEEPRLLLPRAEWNGAQAGFRLYEEWLAIINAHPTTRGLPAYISSTNTFTPDSGIPPARNYPAGWLTSAFEVVNQEPQIRALVWFLDSDPSGDNQWEPFALSHGMDRVGAAATEFDRLLSIEPGSSSDDKRDPEE